MNILQTALLNTAVNRYVNFIDCLIESGWCRYGDNKFYFMQNPYSHSYGAMNFFEKDGELHSICVALNADDLIEVPGIVFAREYNLSDTDLYSFEKVFESSIDILGSQHASILNKKYQEAVELDFEYDRDVFLEYKSGTSALFLNAMDEVVCKPIAKSQYRIEECISVSHT